MSIVDNKKAFHDYFIEERYEAGLVLEGWEVKAIRAGRAQIKEAYVVVKGGEVFLHRLRTSARCPPPRPTSTPIRCARASCCCTARKSAKLIGKVERAGYALVPLDLHLHQGPHQAGDRPGQGQEAVRQARDRKNRRTGSARRRRLMRNKG